MEHTEAEQRCDHKNVNSPALFHSSVEFKRPLRNEEKDTLSRNRCKKADGTNGHLPVMSRFLPYGLREYWTLIPPLS
eukprot:scaffold242828_cov14-Tisochrysis_lutea.AAC.2